MSYETLDGSGGAGNLDVVHADRDESSLGWITSYSDLVTLLLCFFILFFAIYAKKKIEDVRQEAKTLAERKMNEKLQKIKTIALDDKLSDTQFVDIKDIYSKITKIPGIKTKQARDYFLITFAKGNFFDSGETQLNLKGQYNVAMVLERLLPHAKEVYIEIQGHADKGPSSRGLTKIEMSASRAMTVYDYFTQFGFPTDALSIAGFADHRQVHKKGADEEDLEWLAINRRITFRVEAR